MLGDLCRYPEDVVEDARREPRVGKTAHHLDAGARRLLRSLENERAACRERATNLSRRREHGKVPRREGGYDAHRLLHHQLASAFGAAGHDAAVAAAAL